MNCRKVQNLISAYLDGELAGHEMLLVRHHLTDCGECSVEYESLLGMKRAFGRLKPKRPSDELAVRICGQLPEVHVPFYTQLLASLRQHVYQFPAGVKVGALGAAVLAVLLLIRGGDVSVGPHVASIPVSSATLQTFAEPEPIRVVTISVPDHSLSSDAVGYSTKFVSWGPTSTHRQIPQAGTPGNLLLTGYDR